jgi:hypothetical protein
MLTFAELKVSQNSYLEFRTLKVESHELGKASYNPAGINGSGVMIKSSAV